MRGLWKQVKRKGRNVRVPLNCKVEGLVEKVANMQRDSDDQFMNLEKEMMEIEERRAREDRVSAPVTCLAQSKNSASNDPQGTPPRSASYSTPGPSYTYPPMY